MVLHSSQQHRKYFPVDLNVDNFVHLIMLSSWYNSNVEHCVYSQQKNQFSNIIGLLCDKTIIKGKMCVYIQAFF